MGAASSARERPAANGPRFGSASCSAAGLAAFELASGTAASRRPPPETSRHTAVAQTHTEALVRRHRPFETFIAASGNLRNRGRRGYGPRGSPNVGTSTEPVRWMCPSDGVKAHQTASNVAALAAPAHDTRTGAVLTFPVRWHADTRGCDVNVGGGRAAEGPASRRSRRGIRHRSRDGRRGTAGPSADPTP